MAIKQVSVFVENKKGKLVEVIEKLAKANINIQAMSIADSKDFGILRLIVSDNDKAVALLEEDTIVKTTDVIAVKMDDIEGALYKVLQTLDKADINVDYSYAFTVHKELDAYVVFRVDNIADAEKILADNGFTLLNNI
ncbi:MAG: amino acid-binding protein [Lachnospiraceae bacterium]|nr:amino acid-binding protein [Lachnospiraceae bacterium]